MNDPINIRLNDIVFVTTPLNLLDFPRLPLPPKHVVRINAPPLERKKKGIGVQCHRLLQNANESQVDDSVIVRGQLETSSASVCWIIDWENFQKVSSLWRSESEVVSHHSLRRWKLKCYSPLQIYRLHGSTPCGEKIV